MPPASGLAPHRLELELTESVLLQDTTAAIGLLQHWRGQGVHTALDDFGTGFSSLAYLRSFPIDKLKIDRAFISELDQANAASAAAIVRSIHDLANALGMTTTAEGVESARQRQVLEDIGCSQAQGYLFARPMSLHEAGRFIRNARALGLEQAMSDARGELLTDRLPPDLRREAKRIAAGSPAPQDSRWAQL